MKRPFDLREFFRSRIIQVWHHDSPGVRVYVKRGWWKRRFYNPYFSEVGEKLLNSVDLALLNAEAEAMARTIHSLRTSVAPLFGHMPWSETRAFDPKSADGLLAIEVCKQLLTGGHTLSPDPF